MAKASRTHHADEFGKTGSTPIRELDASMITVAGITERESGQTPSPSPISMRALVIGLVVMLVLGLAALTVMAHAQGDRTTPEIPSWIGPPGQ